MKKLIIIFIISILYVTSYAQEAAQVTEAKYEKSFSLMPRYFNDNIIVSNNTIYEKKCELYVFSTNGKNVLSQLLYIDTNNYKVPTKSLKKGEYIYFIVENNIPIARGTFTKS